MPKLLIINITCNQASTGIISEQVGLMLKGRGWNVYLAHGARRVNSSKLNTFKFSTIKNEYFHFVKSLLFDGDGLGSKKATERLVEYIKEIKPDVIQLHNLHGYYLNYKILFNYLNSTNIPIVMTIHDCWSFTGHCVHPIIANCNRWKTGCHHCPLKSKYPKKTLGLDGSKRNYDLKRNYIASNPNLHIVAVSEWLASWVYQSIYKEKPVYIIKNGIDLNVFQPYKVESNKEFVILAVSNVWHKDKGLFDYIELSKYLKSDEKIYLVGYSEKKQNIKLPSNIIPISYTKDQLELAMLYNKADVVVSMSYAETFGLTLAEGAACGTPSVVYDNTAQPALVTKSTGLVVENGNVSAMYTAISEIKRKGKMSYTQACLEKARNNFDKEKCFEEYVKLYEVLLEN